MVTRVMAGLLLLICVLVFLFAPSVRSVRLSQLMGERRGDPGEAARRG